MKLKKIYSKLREFEKLEYNWDGYEGKSFSSEVLDRARLFVGRLFVLGIEFPDSVVPCAGGKSVQLEYDSRRLKGSEVEVFEEGFSLLLRSEKEYHNLGLEEVCKKLCG